MRLASKPEVPGTIQGLTPLWARGRVLPTSFSIRQHVQGTRVGQTGQVRQHSGVGRRGVSLGEVHSPELCGACVVRSASAPAPAPAAAPAAAGNGAQPAGKKQGVKDWSADKVLTVMRIGNFLNGAIMIAGAILQLFTGVVGLDFQVLLLSVYITCVQCVLVDVWFNVSQRCVVLLGWCSSWWHATDFSDCCSCVPSAT